jgi:hypothetical protein
MSHRAPPSLPLPPEIHLEIFSYLTEDVLISLATVSTVIHELSLRTALARYGIVEETIRSQNFPQISTNGAFPAFCLARFIRGARKLNIYFDPQTDIYKTLRALEQLSRKFVHLPQIDLDLTSWCSGPQALKFCSAIKQLW